MARPSAEEFQKAFDRPAIRTAPAGYATPEAAEAEGWAFDAVAGRWHAPAASRAIIDRLYKLAKTLTDERVDKMGLQQLRDALDTMAASPIPQIDKLYHDIRRGAGHSVPADERELDALRLQVKRKAAAVQAVTKSARKSGGEAIVKGPAHASADASRLAVGVAKGCGACGKPAAAGTKLLSCSQCRAVVYCDAACQKAHWKTHKAFCKIAAKKAADIEKEGIDSSKQQDVLTWLASVPHLMNTVECIAWRQRHKQPRIEILGGVNARLAKVSVLPRSRWEGADPYLASRYAQADFDTDTHYFFVARAGHAGTETWPAVLQRCRFPCPPAEMDALVEQLTATIPPEFVAMGLGQLDT